MASSPAAIFVGRPPLFLVDRNVGTLAGNDIPPVLFAYRPSEKARVGLKND
jgi:hypothetical protein